MNALNTPAADGNHDSSDSPTGNPSGAWSNLAEDSEAAAGGALGESTSAAAGGAAGGASAKAKDETAARDAATSDSVLDFIDSPRAPLRRRVQSPGRGGATTPPPRPSLVSLPFERRFRGQSLA